MKTFQLMNQMFWCQNEVGIFFGHISTGLFCKSAMENTLLQIKQVM